MTTQPSVIFCSMPLTAPRCPLYVVIGVPLGLAALLLAAITSGIALPTILGVGGLCVFILLLMSITVLVGFVRRHQPVDNLALDALSAHERAFIALDHDTPLFVKRRDQLWRWPRICAACESEHVTPPHTVVRNELAGMVSDVDTPAHLLEPEPILPSSAYGPGLLALLLFIYLFNALAAIVTGNVWLAVIWLVAGAAWTISTPSIRDRLRIFRGSEGKIIAGPGWIRDRRGRIWRAGSATMIVTSPSGKPPIHVVVSGPDGCVTLTFMHERDPDFTALWQRWNHPDPRPEFAEA